MEAEYAARYLDLETEHWWHLGRRGAIVRLLEATPRSARVLDIGCSGGTLLAELLGLGFRDVEGVDIRPDAVELCRGRGLVARVEDAQALPDTRGPFDVLIASDVLEHLDEPDAALERWRDLLAPGGEAIVFVPAFMELWSEHDEVNHHRRRYRRGELVELARRAGLDVTRSGYWNSGLFFPIAAVRALMRLSPRRAGAAPKNRQAFTTPRPVNAALAALLQAENLLLARGLNPPIGVSTYVLARRPA